MGTILGFGPSHTSVIPLLIDIWMVQHYMPWMFITQVRACRLLKYEVQAFLELHLSNNSTEFAMWGSKIIGSLPCIRGDIFNGSAHGSKRPTCWCHYYYKYVVYVDVFLRELLILTAVEINTGNQVEVGPARSDLRTAKVVARATPPHSSAMSIPGPIVWNRQIASSMLEAWRIFGEIVTLCSMLLPHIMYER